MQITKSHQFSTRLKQLRQAKGLLQKDMAAELNITCRAFQNYEIGQREPTINVLISLANFFNVSLDYLVGLTDNPARL